MKYRALVTTEDNKIFNNSVQEKSLVFLPDNNTLIKVKYSSLNYKDALSASGSRLVETGIKTFYLLTLIAGGVMIYNSVIKLFKK